MKVFQLPYEEAYIAQSVEEIQKHFVGKLGWDADEFDADEWVEQTGPVTLVLEEDDCSPTDREGAVVVPGKQPGTVRVTKDATQWIEQFRDHAEKTPFCLWTTHT